MKRFIILLFVFVLLIVPSFASSSDLSESSGSSHPLANFSSSFYSVDELSSAFYKAIIQSRSDEINEYTPVSNISIQPLWTGDTGSTVIPGTSLRAVLSSVIGPYSPVVVQYQYTNGSNVQYLREILPDYEWMFNCSLFAMIIWCVFRLWGSVLCKR